MNIAEWSISRSTITWTLMAVMLVVGAISFNSLPRLEDPEFTIKQAIVITPYPGASAEEVEEEVSNIIERAVQEQGEVDWIESLSTRGLSTIKINYLSTVSKEAMPQVFDELRRKVGDYQRQLPPGSGPSIVNDDFGDVYGMYLAITGEGYSDKELYEHAKMLQRDLLSVQDVRRIVLYGQQPEQIYVEMRREKMAELGVSQQDIYNALASKNLPSPSGNISFGREYIPINPTGEFTSEKEFGELLISAQDPKSTSLIYLKDVADIVRGYQDPPTQLLRYDGKPAVGLAISTVAGGNVVTMGAGLEKRLAELQSQTPLGIELHAIAMQPKAVTESISGFLINLGEAIAIVVVVLLIFMGLRSGLIIGFILLLTIMGTFILMSLKGLTLERISLGALVIALGMLVDNAIVIIDGMRMKMKQGVDATIAARDVVAQTSTPLLGATFIAIAAFAAIGTSPDSTGEYCASLFWVILMSLGLSWYTAVTSAPLLGKTFLKVESGGAEGDAYSGKIYSLYRSFLTLCIRYRWITVVTVVAMFVVALIGFGQLKQSFFPDSTRPQFYVDFTFTDGTHVDEVRRQMEIAEKLLFEYEEVTHIATEIGGSQPRFMLTYSPLPLGVINARLLADVDDYNIIPELNRKIQKQFGEVFPQGNPNTRMFLNGPNEGGRVQLRINGPDPAVLRQMGDKVMALFAEEPRARGVRNEWGNPVKVLRPQLAEAQARRAGITRPMIAQALEAASEGTRVGVYRERDELLPIIARAPLSERITPEDFDAVQVWSPAARGMIPLGQVVNGFKVEFELPLIGRRDRVRMLRIHADAAYGLPSELLAAIKPKIEQALGVDMLVAVGKEVDPKDWNANTIPIAYGKQVPLKGMPGYSIGWGGEAEDSSRSQAALIPYVKIFFGLMILLVVLLFNSIKKTLVIWLTVPLSIIGVTLGLLLFSQPFGFMSLLGMLSLAGMLIKNAIVLIDQIDLELKGGKPGLQAIVDSGVSRLIPVSMAALTTIFGMIPLLTDAFFKAMSITIMFGLGFATVLTLIFVPVLYSMFFGIRE